MKVFVRVFFFLQLVSFALAAPLVNGDFSTGPGDPGWRFVTPGSGSNVGGSINIGLGNATLNAPSPVAGFLGVGSILGTRMQLQVNAAINAVSSGAANILTNANALVGLVPLARGSMIYQTFDTLSGNPGQVVEYIYSASMNGSARAFAYFFGIDTQEETLVLLGNGTNVTGSFDFGTNTRMLVGFGVLGIGGGSNGVLTIEGVSQEVPEIDTASAGLPVAVLTLCSLVLWDRKRATRALT